MVNKTKTTIYNAFKSIVLIIAGLFYIRPLSLFKAIVASITGAAVAILLSPYFFLEAPNRLHCAIVFLLGLFSISFVAIIFEIVDRIQRLSVITKRTILSTIRDVVISFRETIPRRRKTD